VIDILPTGVELPVTIDGRPARAVTGKSLVSVRRGGTREAHAFLSWEHAGNLAEEIGVVEWSSFPQSGRSPANHYRRK
jgi:hypothetical protein